MSSTAFLLATENYQLAIPRGRGRHSAFEHAAEILCGPKGEAKSFVFPERDLKTFVMPDVQPHYLVSTCSCTTAGGGVGFID